MAKPTPATSRAPDVSFRGSVPETPDRRRRACIALAALAPFGVAAQAPRPAPGRPPTPRPGGVDRQTASRLFRLDPDRIAAADVHEVLQRVPAPRIVALHGSVALVTMEPLAEFLISMGFPADKLAHPRDGALTHGSFGSSEVLAGTIAWHYERDGIVPLLIGHSQGGMLAIRTLHELAGAFSDSLAVWDPVLDEAQPRVTITDPRTGRERPVIGLKLPWAAAIATGKLPRLMLGQWSMLARLTRIPDTVDEFTGFAMEWDPIAGNFGSVDPYVATGTARVRNVLLPSAYNHISLPQLAHLAAQPAIRAWINDYAPDRATALPSAEIDIANIVHAAEIWHSVKRHWCREAQHLLAATAEKATS
jgi:hypothetical protein